jgi:hypothetical protein
MEPFEDKKDTQDEEKSSDDAWQAEGEFAQSGGGNGGFDQQRTKNMVIGVVAAEELFPGSANEFQVGGGFVDDDRLVGGAIAANGESEKGCGEGEQVFASKRYRQWQKSPPAAVN